MKSAAAAMKEAEALHKQLVARAAALPAPAPPAAASRAAAARPISPAVSLSRAMADLDAEAQALSEREESDPRSVPPPPKSLSSLRFLEGALAKLASAVDGADADPTPDARAGFAQLESTLAKTLAVVGGPEDGKSRGAEREAASGRRAAHRAVRRSSTDPHAVPEYRNRLIFFVGVFWNSSE